MYLEFWGGGSVLLKMSVVARIQSVENSTVTNLMSIACIMLIFLSQLFLAVFANRVGCLSEHLDRAWSRNYTYSGGFTFGVPGLRNQHS